MPLGKYYAGGKAFTCLVVAYEKEWGTCSFKEELLAAVDGDMGIAVVLFGKLAGDSLRWLEKEVPALDGLTAKECLTTKDGIKRLKECLLRMPS